MNDSLKKAQAAYQEKCRVLNIRFNKETDQELIEWLDLPGFASANIKALIKNDIQRMKNHLVRVDFFDAEVKYSGDIEDYTVDQILEMAKAQIDRGRDNFDHDEIMNEFEARKIDGKAEIYKVYESNHLAYIQWSYISEIDPEDEEE